MIIGDQKAVELPPQKRVASRLTRAEIEQINRRNQIAAAQTMILAAKLAQNHPQPKNDREDTYHWWSYV